ncbi:MAG: DUF933 domain-containing protein [Planctomycetota bacterium]
MLGLKNSGKTTLFNALTRGTAEVTPYSLAKGEPNVGVVRVEDGLVEDLARIYRPKKTTFATVNFVDFVGLSRGSAKDGGLSGEAVDWIRNADALALVVRNFPDDLMGETAPLSDLNLLVDEMLIDDMMVAQTRIERIEWSLKRGFKKTPQLEREERVLEKVAKQLDEGGPVGALDLTIDEKKTIKGFHFLSAKPALVVVNSDESAFGKSDEILAEMGASFPALEFAGKFEMELSRLEDPEDARLFMEDLGIGESARTRLTRAAYEMLGRISFYTVGEDEVRAWSIREGGSAVDAAGAIHSDLARGFIRAECFSTSDLLECGSERKIKEEGRFRLEGKNYIVQAGDILSIRFSV